MLRAIAVVLVSLSLVGCAAVFRSPKETIHVDSTPPGAVTKRGDATMGPTPIDMEVDRGKTQQITLAKPGFEDQHLAVKKSVNGGWLFWDLATCVFPIALCIPLLVDAISGAWNDLDPRYTASLTPGTSSGAAASAASRAPASPSASAAGASASAGAPAPTSAGPPADMSESERKATARAAFLEGVKLQDSGNCPEALARLETAQKFYAAPTHLLHIAQCQAATGKLVEASETLETLVRTQLTKEAPDAFRSAQDSGKKELTAIRPRIPTLRIQITPALNTLSSVVVKLNGGPLPNEVIGLARPVNPGTYKITVWAAGYREANAEVEVGEASARVADLKLQK